MSAGASMPTAPIPAPRPRVTPSAWWYAGAGAIALAGIVAGVWIVVEGVGDETLLGLFGGVVGGVLVAGLSIVAAPILALCVGVARSRNRRRSLPPPPPYTGWAPPPTWPTPVRLWPARQDAQPQPRLPSRAVKAAPTGRLGAPEPRVARNAPTLPGAPPVGSASSPVNGRPDAPLPWPVRADADRPDAPLPWSRPAPTAVSRPGDPPSLRSPADWSRSDVEIPWDPDSL